MLAPHGKAEITDMLVLFNFSDTPYEYLQIEDPFSVFVTPTLH
jgi:hypothetical protein